MMLEMLKTNQIAANSRNVFSMIYQSDAVEFAYRVMMAEHPKYPLYHISSGEVISQMTLAELIGAAQQAKPMYEAVVNALNAECKINK